MEAKAYNIYNRAVEDGKFEEVEEQNYTNFDVNELFCFTIINDDDGNPEFIEILSKNNVRCNLVYDDDLIIALAKEFKRREKK